MPNFMINLYEIVSFSLKLLHPILCIMSRDKETVTPYFVCYEQGQGLELRQG